MQKYFFILFLLFTLSSFSQSTTDKRPVVDPIEIVKDIMSWLYYQRDHLVWSADYITLDTSLNPITKGDFLERLISGRYLPLEIKTSDGSLCYQLYEIKKSVDKDIVATIKNMAIKELHYYKMEGLSLPDFNFFDLDGNVYNHQTTTNKIVVLNCWFVRCTPCVAEMPSLNQIVKQFEKQKNIIFLALALDPANEVRMFLNEHSFKYAIVPDKTDYLSNKLNIIAYPTQLIINRQGMIVKVLESNKISELKNILIKELQK